MRVLLSFTGGAGHLLPLLPLARAAARRGHEVAVSGQEAMAEVVQAAGWSFLPSGGATLADPSARGPLLPVDRAHEERVVREVFAGRTAGERADRLLEVIAQWRPDVVLRDELDLGAAVAAERSGLPHVDVMVLAAGGLLRADVVAEPMGALRAAHGLPAAVGVAGLRHHLTLAPVPPSFRDPQHPLPPRTVLLRPTVLDDAADGGPLDPTTADVLAWLAARERPAVLVTLGTVFPQESGDLFRRVLDALAPLEVSTVVTVGSVLDPRELGAAPDSVRVERYLPLAALLPHCDAVVCHAGSGSVVGALAFGVPLVLLPMGADQPLNADRCADLGVGRVLDPVSATTREVRDAVQQVVRDPRHRRAAQRLRDESASLPSADTGVHLLEELVGVARPAVG